MTFEPHRHLYAMIPARPDYVLAVLEEHPHLLQARFTENQTLLQIAAIRDPCFAHRLIDLGAKLDFISAIALDRVDTVQAMLASRPHLIRRHSPNRLPALHIAVGHSSPEMVSLLLANGADPNDRTSPQRHTPIFWAGRAPFANATVLLNAGADLQARAKHGFTVLHEAAKCGKAGFVEYLLAHGADPNLQTDGRQTPWALAVRFGHHEVARLLR